MLDDQGMGDGAERAQGNPVADNVGHKRAAGVRLERMGMVPELIRAFDLLIDETVGRRPVEDFGTPADRQEPPADGVLDKRARFHRDWKRGANLEMEPGRGKLIEVSCIGKKGKDSVDRLWDELLSAEGVFWHDVIIR